MFNLGARTTRPSGQSSSADERALAATAHRTSIKDSGALMWLWCGGHQVCKEGISGYSPRFPKSGDGVPGHEYAH